MDTARRVSIRRTGGLLAAIERGRQPTPAHARPASRGRRSPVSPSPARRGVRRRSRRRTGWPTGASRRSPAPRPVAPGCDRLDGAVVVGQLELGDRPDVAAVDGAPATAEAEAAAVPPLGDGHPDHVRAGGEGRCDVRRAVAEAMSVAGPTGSEHLVADGRPVEQRGVHAERGGVEPGPSKAGAHGEGASEPDRPFRVLAHAVGGDRHRRPVRRLEQGDLEVERFAPRRTTTAGVTDPHAHLPPSARRQRRERPRHEHRLVRAHGLGASAARRRQDRRRRARRCAGGSRHRPRRSTTSAATTCRGRADRRGARRAGR